MVTLERQLMVPILPQGLRRGGDGDDLEEGEIPEFDDVDVDVVDVVVDDDDDDQNVTPLEKVAQQQQQQQQPVALETSAVKPDDQTALENCSELRTVESYVNKVTLAAACKSLDDACEQLYQALSILTALPSTALADKLVGSLASKFVDKICIIHRVYHATEAPLRVYHCLTKLANFYSEKVFTPEQLRELNSLVQRLKENRHDYVPWDGVIEESPSPPMTSYGTSFSGEDDVPDSPTPSHGHGQPIRDSVPSIGLVRKRETPETDINLKRLKLDKPPPPSGGWLVDEDSQRVTQALSRPPSQPSGGFLDDEQPETPTPQQHSGGFFDLESPTPHQRSGGFLEQLESPTSEHRTGGFLDENNGEPLHPELEAVLLQLSKEERDAFFEERRRRSSEHEEMLSAGKLCLVLDLDHTLLNSAKFSEVEPNWDTYLRAVESIERTKEGNPNAPRRELYRSTYMSMWTKLRPGIWRFLARASELYVLHLYTMGNKAYATEMAKLLDPTGVLFGSRVIAKGDDGAAAYGDDKVPKSKDLDGVLGLESCALIIDDSTRVWPHHRRNLISVERYMYFPCSRRQFGISGPSLLEAKQDERESDGILASILSAIERVHHEFFQNPRNGDVRDTLENVQRSILAGCKIVFSRIFPVEETQPQLHPLWCLAEQFGAKCTLILEEDVTHVVALSLGTEKCNWALSTGRHLVRPGWVEASAVLYRRANERDFPV